MTTNKTSANVTETESSPITILSAEKQAFAALFCKGIVRQVTKQMHNLFAKNGSLHSPEQPMPVLLCGHFAFPQFWRPWCSEQTSFSKKTNRLFIKHFQCFARNFPNRGSPESITAIRKLKCTDPLKNNPLSTRSQRLRYAKYTKCHRFLQQPFSNAVSESESSIVKDCELSRLQDGKGRSYHIKQTKCHPPFWSSIRLFELRSALFFASAYDVHPMLLALFAVLSSKHTKSDPILHFRTVFRPWKMTQSRKQPVFDIKRKIYFKARFKYIFPLFAPHGTRCTFSNMCPRRCSAGVKSWKYALSVVETTSNPSSTGGV